MSSVAEAPSVPVLPEIERRSVEFRDFEMREAGDALIFEGHAAVFNRWSEQLGGPSGFREQIKPGAFRKAIRSSDSVAFMLNHNPDYVMASSKVKEGPGSLRISEDNVGLHVLAELAPTTAAKDLRVLTKSGVIDSMSFGFSMKPDGRDEWNGDYSERTVHQFARLGDVSPVWGPAYPQTDASMRSLVCGFQLYDHDEPVEEILQAVATRIHRGTLTASVEERGRVDAAYAALGRLSPWTEELARRTLGLEPAEINASPTETEERDIPASPVGPWRLADRKRRLRLIHLES